MYVFVYTRIHKYRRGAAAQRLTDLISIFVCVYVSLFVRVNLQ